MWKHVLFSWKSVAFSLSIYICICLKWQFHSSLDLVEISPSTFFYIYIYIYMFGYIYIILINDVRGRTMALDVVTKSRPPPRTWNYELVTSDDVQGTVSLSLACHFISVLLFLFLSPVSTYYEHVVSNNLLFIYIYLSFFY